MESYCWKAPTGKRQRETAQVGLLRQAARGAVLGETEGSTELTGFLEWSVPSPQGELLQLFSRMQAPILSGKPGQQDSGRNCTGMLRWFCSHSSMGFRGFGSTVRLASRYPRTCTAPGACSMPRVKHEAGKCSSREQKCFVIPWDKLFTSYRCALVGVNSIYYSFRAVQVCIQLAKWLEPSNSCCH